MTPRNSVFAAGCPADLDRAIRGAERFYAGHEQPPIFLVSEGSTPERVTEALRKSGRRPTAATWVLAADGAVAAVGQVVVVDGIGCVQYLVTLPEARRRGAGRSVVDALLRAAGEIGATGAVAAIMAANEPSLRLFTQLGFERSHRYEYYASEIPEENKPITSEGRVHH